MQKQKQSACAEEKPNESFTRFISIFHGQLEASVFTTEVEKERRVVNNDDDDN